MKKTIAFIMAGGLLMAMFALPMAYAQTATAVGGSASGYAPAGVVSSPPAIIVSPAVPISPSGESGFIQFDDLIFQSVSATNPPAEIMASNPNIYPIVTPMSTGVSSGASAGTGASASAGTNVSVNTTVTVTAAPTCYRFATQNAATGQAISCPASLASATTSANTSTATPAGTPSVAPTANSSGPAIIVPPPIRYQPYRIEVSASTSLMLNDRMPATLSSFSAGDEINVFGYYNSDGSIQAYLIRDLSKPVQDQFIQLNNVELVSISTSTGQTSLVVSQAQGYPCYGFGANGTTKQSIACPLGVSAASNNSALQNVTVPAALVPMWQALRKYVVNIDSQTVILDSNRTSLSLSQLQIGDQLNVYGDTTDNGQTLSADIVRDLSIPATPTTYSGTITQVNADGSFVVQTSGGQTITVQSPIQVGAKVQLSGLLNRSTNMLTQVSNMNFGGTTIYNYPPVPVTMNVPGAANTQN